MKSISFEKLYNTEFYVTEPMVKPQYWAARGDAFNALGKPKISHTLLWFKNCMGVITLPTGEEIAVPHNALVYTAKGIEYAIHFFETNADKEDTVVIHFQLTDKSGEDITPTVKPVVCLKNVSAATALLFDMLSEECKKNVICIPEVVSGIYKILAEICQKQKKRTTKNKFSRIRRGIELLEGDNDLSIGDIAAECGVSECYFRRMFYQYSGETPMQFRQRYRIERAKQLLLSDEHYTVGEVAAELHFLDIYHFSKTFKKFCGVSPNKFQQSESEKADEAFLKT